MQPDLLDYDHEPQPEAFTIEDDAAAEWAIRKIAAAQARIKDADKLYQGELYRLECWHRDTTKSDTERIEFFQGLLTAYHAAQLAEDPGRKTIKLPHGTLTSRAQGPVYEFTDDYLAWAAKNAPETLRERAPEVDKTAAKAYLQETGEVAPGVTITERGPSFSVKVSH
jgi:hypothetical protein